MDNYILVKVQSILIDSFIHSLHKISLVFNLQTFKKSSSVQQTTYLELCYLNNYERL